MGHGARGAGSGGWQRLLPKTHCRGFSSRVRFGGMDQTVDQVPLGRALHRLAYPSPPVRYALKFGTTMVAALWFAYSSELSDKVSIFITILFVMQPTSGGSIKKGLPRIAGTVACALICILIYGLFAQVPPLFLASLCAVIAVGTYGMTSAAAATCYCDHINRI